MHKTCYVFFSMVCARLIIYYFYFYFFSPRRSRRGTLGISSPGGPVEEPLKPFCLFFSLRRLSSSVVFQWGSLRQTLDLSKTTNEKVPWRRPSIKIWSEISKGFVLDMFSMHSHTTGNIMFTDGRVRLDPRCQSYRVSNMEFRHHGLTVSSCQVQN